MNKEILVTHRPVVQTLNAETLMVFHHAHVSEDILEPLQTVAMNAQLIQNVQVQRPAFAISVKILVQVLAESTLCAMSSTTPPSVPALTDISAIPSPVAIQHRLQFTIHHQIPATHRLAVQMLNVMMALVHACPNITVTHTPDVALNVS